MIELARRHDVKLLGIIRGTPGWLSSCPRRGRRRRSARPAIRASGASSPARWPSTRAGEIDHWEIVNEPDARWAFPGSAEDYARMLSAAYDAIKQRAPDAQVVFGGVERPREHDWIERVLATPGADAAHKFDIAAVHLRLRLRNTPPRAGRLAHRSGAPLLAAPRLRTDRSGSPSTAIRPTPPSSGTPPIAAPTPPPATPRRRRCCTPRSRCSPRPAPSQIFVTLRDNLYGEYLSEGIVHIDESQPGDPATRRPAFDTVRDLAIGWDPAVYRRSGAIEQQRQAARPDRLAATSSAAGQPLAAAVQAGAAEGHKEVALDLVKATG